MIGTMRRIFVFLFVLATVTILSAQSSSKAMRTWQKGALSWSEFVAEPATGDSALFHIDYDIVDREEKVKEGMTTYLCHHFVPVFDMKHTWVRQEHRTDQMLQYLQIAFDMLEVECRKATNDFADPDNRLFADQVRDFYIEEYLLKYNDLEIGTQSGTDTLMLKVWKDLVSHELQNTKIHFSEKKLNLVPEEDLGLSVGGFFHSPHTSYVSLMGGASLGVQYKRRNHTFLLDFSFGFGKDKVEFETSDGWIEEGDLLLNGQLSLNYGYQFRSSSRIALTPFAGMGLSSYELSADVDEDEVVPRKMGPSLNAGLCLDWTFRQNVDIRDEFGYINQNRRQIRIRPYFSLVHYHGELGWVPSFNISVSFLINELL